VRQLTGNALLDEKKYGSVHVALGHSIVLGGEVQSQIHCSMVCLSPQVHIDGKIILNKDDIALNVQEWREDYREIEPPTTWHSELYIQRTATEARVDEHGYLRRFWDTSSGRVCSIPVGDDETARMAASIYQMIQKRKRPITMRGLAHSRQRIPLPQLLKITYMLKLYGLLKTHDGEV
jgi:hypothetical protein